jgi:hypothetical protein
VQQAVLHQEEVKAIAVAQEWLVINSFKKLFKS